MDYLHDQLRSALTRRTFLRRTSAGLGAAALAALLNPGQAAASAPPGLGILGPPHFAPKAKRVIYLFQSGGPSHMDLFDYKPVLQQMHQKDLPKSVMGEQRVTLMTRNQSKFLCVASPFKFARYGRAGAWMSELLPWTQKIADDICIVKSLHTEPINHDPAVTFMQTGSMVPGRPCMGSWTTYGLGSENADLPGFVVMLSGTGDQPVTPRYYHSGFLPSQFQGVQFQSSGDPVMFLSNPKGIDHENRGKLIDAANKLNAIRRDDLLDSEIQTRIEAFELAYRMQTSVPELTEIKNEPKSVLDLYGDDVKRPGSYAANCLLARRLVERGVRFVQLFHRGWDQHGNLPRDLRRQTRETDQPSAALVMDLKQRGLLEDTLIVWGGEFGRTSYSQGDIRPDSFGRDHHPRCYTMWMAGGGIKGGVVHGSTDDFGYNLAADGVHVNDLHATLLHCLGINHERLTFRFQGRDFRLTDVAGKIVTPLLA
ncbi:MAG TPA: DUF1501 domain-containing protein [Tepidisphaeraceae bacterium]|jgi:hypothetical protein|nr:DUF1501 domain-containing protein [Tepidisphaeraceae bacterium]